MPHPVEVHIDHDHNSGQARGLLCPGCNWGIGWLGDNLAGVEPAVSYLLRHERRQLAKRERRDEPARTSGA